MPDYWFTEDWDSGYDTPYSAGDIITLTAAEAARWNRDASATLVQAVSLVVADPGDGEALPVTYWDAHISFTTAGAETRTLAIPTVEGQRLVLIADDQAAGDCVVTVASAVNAAGNNTLTFGDDGDNIGLLAIDVNGTLRWTIMFNDGVALSTV